MALGFCFGCTRLTGGDRGGIILISILWGAYVRMNRAYIRYLRKPDELNDAKGLLVSALKKTAEPLSYRYRGGKILPVDYHYYYRPEDFLEMEVVLENQHGGKANLRELRHLLPGRMFTDGLTWVLTAVIIACDHFEFYHVGFDTPRVIAETSAFVVLDSYPSWAQTRCVGVCGTEITVGNSRFVARFDVEGGGIPGLPEEYAEISTVVSEYRDNVLFCDYFVPANKPIITHQYIPEN